MLEQLQGPVLITGAAGQLGHALGATVPPGVAVVPLTRADLDIGDEGALNRLLDHHGPHTIINAAAYTAVDRAEDERQAAFRANSEAPALLAAQCERRGMRLLHVSTDFVFDGTQSYPYDVDAPTAPLGVYGESKLAGEQAVLASAAPSLIVRTGWVYGAPRPNLLNTMLRLHREREQLTVVADQVGTPTHAYSLARALWAAAERPALQGVYHWSDAGVCSWYDFAVAIGEEGVSSGLLDRAATVQPIATSDYPTPAQRPAYSVLDKTASWRDFSVQSRHWRDELRACLLSMRTNDHG